MSRVKASSVSISSTFHVPHSLPYLWWLFRTFLHQLLCSKHWANHGVSTLLGMQLEAAERWWYKTTMGIACFDTKFRFFWRGKLISKPFLLPTERKKMRQVAAPHKAVHPWNVSLSKGLQVTGAHLQSHNKSQHGSLSQFHLHSSCDSSLYNPRVPLSHLEISSLAVFFSLVLVSGFQWTVNWEPLFFFVSIFLLTLLYIFYDKKKKSNFNCIKKGLKQFDGNCSIHAHLSLVPKVIGILVTQ